MKLKLILSRVLITEQWAKKERQITNEVYTSNSRYNDKGNLSLKKFLYFSFKDPGKAGNTQEPGSSPKLQGSVLLGHWRGVTGHISAHTEPVPLPQHLQAAAHTAQGSRHQLWTVHPSLAVSIPDQSKDRAQSSNEVTPPWYFHPPIPTLNRHISGPCGASLANTLCRFLDDKKSEPWRKANTAPSPFSKLIFILFIGFGSFKCCTSYQFPYPAIPANISKLFVHFWASASSLVYYITSRMYLPRDGKMQPYKEQESMLFNFEFSLLKKKGSKNIKYQQASQSRNILLQRQNSSLGSNPIARRFHWVLLTWSFLISRN